MIPLFKVFMSPAISNHIIPVLHSGYIGEGEKVRDFEAEFSKLIKNDKVIMTNSGTSAITMALRLANVNYEDSVITTPMTCLATNMAILSLGASPIWADILEDGTIDPISVEKKVTKKTKAILCVDWGGLPCKLDELKTFNIPVIEDACQCTCTSTYKASIIGKDADYTCFSFQAIKYLTTGDGGMLTLSPSSDQDDTARFMRWFGLDRRNGKSMRCKQDPPIWGYKFQPNDIAASIGLANIRYIKSNSQKAKVNADLFTQELSTLAKVKIIKEDIDRVSSYWLYTIFVEDPLDFISYMAKNDVECSQVHDRNDSKTIFKAWRCNDLPGVDYFDEHHVCIPVGWWLTPSDIDYIIYTIKSY